MLQRIQTVYMLISVLLLIICACLPIGTFIPDGMGAPSDLYNICVIDGETGSWHFSVAGLFALLAGAVVSTIINIFSYNNRKAQSRDCLINIILLLAWIGLYAFEMKMMCPEGYTPHFIITAILPIIAIIFQWLARRGIIHDEKLIRSVDRIR